jgi:sec-independent protein translocase protein TatA
MSRARLASDAAGRIAMFGLSWVHWLIVLGVVVLLFGGARFSGILGDLGTGVRAFQKGLSDPDSKSPPKDE